ncbi:MAG: SPOR domain-containing protein [Clostridia bacterium]|nr:SPOR domain-containing protein [Clostridia bacterium]MBP3651163.1 SPOR domain-containing protein [Clostridia bacterium]
MQDRRKVYPSGHAPIRWISWLLLLAAAVVFLGGLLPSRKPSGTITPLPTETPYPLTESFDETMETCQWSLPAVEWYALQLGAFDNEASAKTMAEQFQARGAAGYLWQEERFRLLAAIYASETDARNVRQQISQQHEVESYLYRISLPPVAVSIHGMRGQIEILQAAFGHASDLITAMQETGLAADRGESTREEQLAKLSALDEQMQLVKLRLYQRFPEPRNSCVTGLIQLFDDYSGFATSMDPQETEVMFSTKLKYQTLRSLDLLRQVYDILGNT